MASGIRTSGVFLLLFLILNTHATSPPWILSVNYLYNCVDCVNKIHVNGTGIFEWSITYKKQEKGQICKEPFVVRETELDVEVYIPGGEWYFCAKGEDGVWIHQDVFLAPDDVSGR
jgi:hypothetical protein